LRDDFLNPSFHPEINERSKKIKRSGSVGDILYEDAVNRKEMNELRIKCEEERRQPEIRKLWSNEKSDKVLAKMLERELKNAVENIESSRGDI
jgi:ribosomal protein L22